MLLHDHRIIEGEERHPLLESERTVPFFLRTAWLAFWVFTITYVVGYLIPALQNEIAVSNP